MHIIAPHVGIPGVLVALHVHHVVPIRQRPHLRCRIEHSVPLHGMGAAAGASLRGHGKESLFELEQQGAVICGKGRPEVALPGWSVRERVRMLSPAGSMPDRTARSSQRPHALPPSRRRIGTGCGNAELVSICWMRAAHCETYLPYCRRPASPSVRFITQRASNTAARCESDNDRSSRRILGLPRWPSE